MELLLLSAITAAASHSGRGSSSRGSTAATWTFEPAAAGNRNYTHFLYLSHSAATVVQHAVAAAARLPLFQLGLYLNEEMIILPRSFGAKGKHNLAHYGPHTAGCSTTPNHQPSIIFAAVWRR